MKKVIAKILQGICWMLIAAPIVLIASGIIFRSYEIGMGGVVLLGTFFITVFVIMALNTLAGKLTGKPVSSQKMSKSMKRTLIILGTVFTLFLIVIIFCLFFIDINPCRGGARC